MKATEFIQRLRTVEPKEQELLHHGWSESYFRQLLASYEAEPRAEFREYGDEFLNLIHNYDASKIEITLVHFDLYNDSPYGIPPSERFLRVGFAEADLLVIDKTTGEIAIEDLESCGFIMLYCAKTSENFLDALLEMAKPNTEYLTNVGDVTSVDWCRKASVCAGLAGGDKYLGFYQMALGCEP